MVPIEIYTPERRAEFLLNNAVSTDDYRRSRAAVKRMALDPDRIKQLSAIEAARVVRRRAFFPET